MTGFKKKWTANLLYSELVTYLPDLITAPFDKEESYKLSTEKGGYLYTSPSKDKIIVWHSDSHPNKYPGLYIKEVKKTFLKRIFPFIKPLNFEAAPHEGDIFVKIDCDKGQRLFNFVINNKTKRAEVLNEALCNDFSQTYVKTSEDKLLDLLETLDLKDTLRSK